MHDHFGVVERHKIVVTKEKASMASNGARELKAKGIAKMTGARSIQAHHGVSLI
jgi:hypothetical protein